MARKRGAEVDDTTGSLAFSAGVLLGRPLTANEYAARRDAATQQALARYGLPRALPTCDLMCSDAEVKRYLPPCSLQDSPAFKSWQTRRHGTHARQYALCGVAAAAAVLLALSMAAMHSYR